MNLRSFRDWIWQKTTSLQKRQIYWEDRLGLFPYWMWIKTVEQPQLGKIKKSTRVDLASSPLVGFVIADDHFERGAIDRTIKSLQQFRGLRWILSILLPEDSPLHQAAWFQDLISENPKLQVINCATLSGYSDWVYQASRLTGDWLVPLSAGDQLSFAWANLFCHVIAQNQAVEIIYWDEDRLTHAGSRSAPFFKPDWSPALLISINYLETAAFRKTLLLRSFARNERKYPGWVFQVTACAAHIEHIAVVLQHRPPLSRDFIQRRMEDQLLRVQSGLRARGCDDVRTEANPEGQLRVSWRTDWPKVSVIIPTKNNLEYIQRCLASFLEKTNYPDFEIILIDDHTTESSVLEYYQQIQSSDPRVHVYPNEDTFNYSRVNNHGARLATGKLLLFLNNDTEILHGDWLSEMVQWVQLPGTGMVGPKLLYPDRSIQHAGIVLGMTGHAYHVYAGVIPAADRLFLSPDVYRNVSAVTGACMLIRKDVFEQVGGFDENLKLIFNDVELCQRVRQAGQQIVYTPSASLIHYEGRSRSRYNPPDDIRLGAEVLAAEIERGDQYYNANLSLAVGWPTFRRWFEPEAIKRLREIVQHSYDVSRG